LSFLLASHLSKECLFFSIDCLLLSNSIATSPRVLLLLLLCLLPFSAAAGNVSGEGTCQHHEREATSQT
jgi:hypothetical protein